MRKNEREDETDKWLFEGYEHEAAGRLKKAISVYRKAAQRGCTSAQINMGNLLDDKIKPARPKEAVQWYKRAIRAGSTMAVYNLAIHHRNRGNTRWAAHWFQIAINMGDPDAPSELRKLKRLRRRAKRV